jgi:hypothetical protein
MHPHLLGAMSEPMSPPNAAAHTQSAAVPDLSGLLCLHRRDPLIGKLRWTTVTRVLMCVVRSDGLISGGIEPPSPCWWGVCVDSFSAGHACGLIAFFGTACGPAVC